MCASCDTIPAWSAAIIGAIGGGAYIFWSWFTIKIKVDDPLDSFAGMIEIRLFDFK